MSLRSELESFFDCLLKKGGSWAVGPKRKYSSHWSCVARRRRRELEEGERRKRICEQGRNRHAKKRLKEMERYKRAKKGVKWWLGRIGRWARQRTEESFGIRLQFPLHALHAKKSSTSFFWSSAQKKYGATRNVYFIGNQTTFAFRGAFTAFILHGPKGGRGRRRPIFPFSGLFRPKIFFED